MIKKVLKVIKKILYVILIFLIMLNWAILLDLIYLKLLYLFLDLI